ncbi:MAG: 4Fe-4S dicluster domain-containing protein [Desulfosarcinaceae bacterium]
MDELCASSEDSGPSQAGIKPSRVSAPPPALKPEGSGTRHPRRQFIRRSLAAAGALATAGIWHAPASAAETDPSAPKLFPEAFADGNQLERMRRELLRALEKKPDERKWVMLIDQQKCVGCSACTISCCAENNLPPGVVYRPVPRRQVGRFPAVNWVFTPRPCMHCDNPPCVPVCPVKATWKEPDGAVVIDYDVCIGCRNCLAACPYNARTADFGEFYGRDTPEIMSYETRPNYEYSREWQRSPEKESSPIGNARKCHFCQHRVKAGLLPACVTTCLGGATYFGDAKDPTGLVNRLMGSNRVRRLKEELGTQPSVYYLV